MLVSCGSRRGSCMVTNTIQCMKDANTRLLVLFEDVKVADDKPIDECPGIVESYSVDLARDYEVRCVVGGFEPPATINTNSDGSDEISCASNGLSISYILGDESSIYETSDSQSEQIQCTKYKGHYET